MVFWSVDLVEVGGGVLADGADIVRRQRFALVDIAADAADPMMELFTLRGGGLWLGFWLDMGKIVGIGGTGQVVLGAGFGDLCDKQGMAAAIDGGDHLPADDGIGDLPGEVQQAIGAAGAALEALEFIDLPAALEAERPELCKWPLSFSPSRAVRTNRP